MTDVRPAAPPKSGGRVSAPAESGATHVVDRAASRDDLAVQVRNETPGLVRASPAAVDGRLSLRPADALRCIAAPEAPVR
ncbi:hypothetical protein [Alienimonas sp. DA493]|uniref:hypothetical protein n=1 Tax=Alienimonas sp. DA493 TaxID=3373605 RepID=UPI003754918A